MHMNKYSKGQEDHNFSSETDCISWNSFSYAVRCFIEHKLCANLVWDGGREEDRFCFVFCRREGSTSFLGEQVSFNCYITVPLSGLKGYSIFFSFKRWGCVKYLQEGHFLNCSGQQSGCSLFGKLRKNSDWWAKITASQKRETGEWFFVL